MSLTWFMRLRIVDKAAGRQSLPCFVATEWLGSYGLNFLKSNPCRVRHFQVILDAIRNDEGQFPVLEPEYSGATDSSPVKDQFSDAGVRSHPARYSIACRPACDFRQLFIYDFQHGEDIDHFVLPW